METTVAATVPLPLSASRATTAANVQMALESDRPQASAFLHNAQPYHTPRLEDLVFPDMEMFKNVCPSGHPLHKVNMSDFLKGSSKKTFRCTQCDEDIGMARATTTIQGPSWMLVCAQLCKAPYGAMCATCAGMANCTSHSDQVSNLNAATLHGQLLAETGNHSALEIGHSVSAQAARLTALSFLPPERTTRGIEGSPGASPGALEDSDWIMLEHDPRD